MRIKKHIRDLYYAITRKTIRTLAYHSISTNTCDPYAITPEQFNEEMRRLSDNKYNIISLEDVVGQLISGQIRPKTMALTFDDGFLDNYEMALPIIEKYGFKATFFVVVGQIGGKSSWAGCSGRDLMDWNELEDLIRRGQMIGSHSWSHLDLRKVSEQVLERELKESVAVLKNRLQIDFVPFSFPYGYYEQRLAEQARAAGYSCAVVGNEPFGNNRYTDLWTLKREIIVRAKP